MNIYLSFEKAIAELDLKISELKLLMQETPSLDLSKDIERLEKRLTTHLKDLYRKLEPWQKVQVARHADRPQTSDYIRTLFTHYTPLAGDRLFGEDEAIVGGLAQFNHESVVVIGHERGRDVATRMRHNFGMANPEGYRKAIRLMRLADKFGLPIITFVNTAGAYPGRGAEERGQGHAIATCMACQLSLKVPIATVIIGEGGSGGAIALACANAILMLEHSIYSVISPEGAASILWRSSDKAREAASTMKLTAQDLLKFGVIDGIVPEPVGGAHREPETSIETVGEALSKTLDDLKKHNPESLLKKRQEKFLTITEKYENLT